MYLLQLMCKMYMIFFLYQKKKDPQGIECNCPCFILCTPCPHVSIYKWFCSFYLPCCKGIPVPLRITGLAALGKYSCGTQAMVQGLLAYVWVAVFGLKPSALNPVYDFASTWSNGKSILRYWVWCKAKCLLGPTMLRKRYGRGGKATEWPEGAFLSKLLQEQDQVTLKCLKNVQTHSE